MQRKMREHHTHPPFSHFFLAASITAILENIIFFPVTRTITLLQTTQKKLSLRANRAEIKQLILPNVTTPKAAIYELYKGIWPNTLYRILQRNIMFALQPIIKFGLDKLAGTSIENQLGKQYRDPLLSGSAGIASSLLEIICLPLSTISIRMQAQGCTLKEAIATGNLYSGSKITAIRNIEAALILYTYSSYLKQKFNAENKENITFWQQLYQELYVASAASTASTAFSHPIDTIKTRMQAAPLKQSILKTTETVWMQEGYKGFLRGFFPRLISATPRTIFSMTMTNEIIHYAASLSKQGIFAQEKSKRFKKPTQPDVKTTELLPPAKTRSL